MYRVYRDPEGEHCLDQHSYKSNSDGNANHQSEEEYKKRIQSLNLEIKRLNERLEKVLCLHESICYPLVIKLICINVTPTKQPHHIQL